MKFNTQKYAALCLLLLTATACKPNENKPITSIVDPLSTPAPTSTPTLKASVNIKDLAFIKEMLAGTHDANPDLSVLKDAADVDNNGTFNAQDEKYFFDNLLAVSGDVNGDGFLSKADADMMAEIEVGNLDSDPNLLGVKKVCDISGNGRCGVDDSLAVINRLRYSGDVSPVEAVNYFLIKNGLVPNNALFACDVNKDTLCDINDANIVLTQIVGTADIDASGFYDWHDALMAIDVSFGTAANAEELALKEKAGDMDKNGTFDVTDLLKVIQKNIGSGDINGDGQVTYLDYLATNDIAGETDSQKKDLMRGACNMDGKGAICDATDLALLYKLIKSNGNLVR